jgi:hypothetical protein
MKYFKLILISTTLNLLTATLFSQNISELYMDKLKPISPAQHQVQKYGEIELSEYQGKPLIDFELWEIKTKGFKLPIKLSYTSNGIKVFDESDWVGMGWDLSIASITQVIYGVDDLKTSGILRKKIPYLCGQVFGIYSYNQNTIPNFTSMSIDNSNQDWDSDCAYSFVKIESKDNCNQWPVTNYYPTDDMHQLNLVDSESDIFVINLMGEQLFCVLQELKTNDLPSVVNLKVLNRKGYKVSYRKSGTPFKWEVVDPNGNIYTFNEENKHINNTLSYTSFGPLSSTTETTRSWLLSSITDIFGDEILFNYSKNTGIHSSSTLEAKKVGVFNKDTQSYFALTGLGWDYTANCGPFIPRPNYVQEGTISTAYNTTVNTTSEKSYIESITYCGNTVLFYTQKNRIDWLNTSKLDSINIFNSGNSKIKKIIFNYEYFTAINDTIIRSNKTKDEATKRLFLVSMKQQNQTYNFFYNETNLPSKDSYALDFWGYFNGQIGNPSKIPNILHFPNEPYDYSLQTLITNNSANLYPHHEFAKAGILNKVVYPTGGYTVYSRSLNCFNNYSIPQSSNQTQGLSYGNGLRVDTVTNYNYNGVLINKKVYEYDNGKLLLPLKHFITSLEQYAEISSSGSGNSYPIYLYSGQVMTIYSSSQFSSGITGEGNGVGYGKVTSYFSSHNVPMISGKTVRYYQNEPDILCPVGMGELIPIVPTYHKGFNNGTLLREETYKGSTIINALNHEYTVVYNSDTIVSNAKLRSLSYVIDGVNCKVKKTLQVSYYPIYKTGTIKTQTKNISFTNIDSISNLISYTYNSDNLLKRVYKQESHQNKENYEEYLYPKDIISSNNYAVDQKEIMINLVSKNRISENIAIIKSITNVNSQSIITQHTYYDQLLCLPIKTQVSLNSDPFFTTSLIKYNSKMNICEVTNDENLYTSYIWSYNGQYPVAEIKNATYSEVLDIDPNLISYIENSSYPSDMDLESLFNSLRNNLPNTLITTYRYKPLVGVVASTDPRGVTIYYTYDNLNKLQYVKDHNNNIIQSFEYNYKQH